MSSLFVHFLDRITGGLASGAGGTLTTMAESFSALVAAGDRARDARSWDAAVTHYRKALVKRPEALSIAVQLGHALKESCNYDEAEKCYRAFLAENQQDADIHLQLGHLFLRQERAKEAREWYEKAEALAPPASTISADAQRGQEDCDKAPLLAVKQRALELTDRGRFQDALEALSVLVVNERCDDLAGVLGNVYKELGRFSEADECYALYEAFARDRRPELLFDAAVQQGHLAKVRRRYEEALGHFARAQELLALTTKPSCSIDELQGEVRVCLGQITKAIELR